MVSGMSAMRLTINGLAVDATGVIVVIAVMLMVNRVAAMAVRILFSFWSSRW